MIPAWSEVFLNRASVSTSCLWRGGRGGGGGELPAVKPSAAASLVSGEHHLGEPDEGVPLRRRPQEADLPDGLLAVTLGQVVGLLHAVALQQEEEVEA